MGKYNLTVANGQTLSNIVDLNGEIPVAVYVPTGLDGTTIGFQTSLDGQAAGMVALITGAGADYSKTIAASKFLPLNPDDFRGARYLRAVLGSQTGDITLTLITKAG